MPAKAKVSLNQALVSFKSAIDEASSKSEIVEIKFSNYKGSLTQLNRIKIRPIFVKSTLKYQVAFSYKTKDIFKNVETSELSEFCCSQLESGFEFAEIISTNDSFLIQKLPNDKWLQRNIEFKVIKKAELNHDKIKNRPLLDSNSPFLLELGITDSNGKIRPNKFDKFKQIGRYLELLQPELRHLKPKNQINLNVCDMGSGKGYLTFALHWYLVSTLKIKTKTRGIEIRKELVEFCNNLSNKLGKGNLQFELSTIVDFSIENDNDILVALHACDTATDEAIFKGITAESQLIVVAPCCHKQIRREIEANAATCSEPARELIKHGVFFQRQAESVTDILRMLVLEYFGYKVKSTEFVSDVHTPKNVMIIAKKNLKSNTKNAQEILNKINELKAFFGIKKHYLEVLTGL